MQTLNAVVTWCVCPVFTVVMTMQELSVLEWACFKTVHEAKYMFGKVKMSESASVMAGFRESACELAGVTEVPTAERTGWKRITPRARPRCRLVPCVWKCATSGRSIGATLCDHPRVSCCRTITARDIAAVVRVSLVCRSSTVLVPQGKSELNCAPRKGTLTSKPQTWIASVVKRRYA